MSLSSPLTTTTTTTPPAPNPISISPSTLTNRQEILTHLSLLESQESKLDSELSLLITTRSKLTNSLETLKSLGPVVSGIENESSILSRQVGKVAETATRVGEKVRGLDREQSRVKESIEFLQQVGELKTSIKFLKDSIEKLDWEGATRSLQRATSIDSKIIDSEFSEAVVPSSELPLNPKQTLIEFHRELLEIFTKGFEKSVIENDTQNIGRFFKLFPMISEEFIGLKLYAEWVSGIIRSKSTTSTSIKSSSSSPQFYSSSLTSLFESIAHIVEQHEPIVSKYYGKGSMLSVMETLMFETDQIGNKVLQLWQEDRKIRTKLVECQQQGQGGGDTIMIEEQQQQEIDPKEIDALLNELNLISVRWQLLRRFLYASLIDQDQVQPQEEVLLPLVEQSKLGKTIFNQLDQVYIPLEFWYLKKSIERAHRMDELDFTNFPPLSSSLDDIFYILKKTLYRSTSLGSIEILEKFNYELNRVLNKQVVEVWNSKLQDYLKELQSITSSNTTGAQAGIAAIGVGVAATLASAGGKTSNLMMRGGGGGEEEKEKKEKLVKKSLIVYLNNLDVAISYTSRLCQELISSSTDLLETSYFLPSEFERAKKSLQTLLIEGSGSGSSIENRFKGVLKIGLDSLFNLSVRNKLRPLLSEVYSNPFGGGGGGGGWYKLDEDGYSQSEYRDEIVKKFKKNWDNLILFQGQGGGGGYKDLLSESNFQQFFITSVSVLVRIFESLILKQQFFKFTQLGGLRFDSDLRSIQSHLMNLSPLSSGSIRESFTRLEQICQILCCDTREEVEEVVLNTTTTTTDGGTNGTNPSASATGGRLTKGEVEVIWNLRV
ncbi:hypothetical protein JCM3765_000310 [Sporobolomyces pararoseus]